MDYGNTSTTENTPNKNINLDTKWFQTMKANFKPSLLTRIIFEGGAPRSKPSPHKLAGYAGFVTPIIQAGGAALTGGADVKLDEVVNIPSFTDHFLARAFIKLFILTLSMYIAIILVVNTGLSKKLFPSVDLEENYDESDIPPSDVFKMKYKKIFMTLLMFVLFTAILNTLIDYIPLLCLYFHFKINKKLLDNTWWLAEESYNNIFNKFISKQGNGNMQFYDSIQRYGLFGVFIFFCIYFFFVKSFIQDMTYAQYTSSIDDELKTEKKFLLHHMLIIVFFILVALGLFAMNFEHRDPLMVIYTLIIVALYSLILCFLVSFELKKKKKFVILMFFILLIHVLINFTTLVG